MNHFPCLTQEEREAFIAEIPRILVKVANGYMSPRTPEEQTEIDKPPVSIYEMGFSFSDTKEDGDA